MNRFQKRLVLMLALSAVLIGGNAYVVTRSADASPIPWYKLTQNLNLLRAS